MKLSQSDMFLGYQVVRQLPGLSARNYLVSKAQKEYVIKLMPGENAMQLLDRQELIQSLDLGGIKTPKLEPLKANIKDGKAAVIYPFIAGRRLNPERCDDDSIAAIGSTLASIHNGLSTLGEPQKDILPQLNSEASTFKERNDHPAIVKESLAVKRTLAAKIKHLLKTESDSDQERPCLLHGDFHNENIIVDAENNIIATIDWESICAGPFWHDFFRFIDLAFFADGITDERISKAKPFINGYRQVRKLDEEELNQGLLQYYYQLCTSTFLENAFANGKNRDAYACLKRDIKKLGLIEHSLNVKIVEP